MSTLLVDNYDSYTYNVFHLLAAACGEEPIVVHNDMVSWRALSRWDFDAIVLSPGPGRPERWHDFGVCADILRFSEVPVLGVCLGHQGLGHVLKAHGDDRADGDARTPLAGQARASGLFEGIPQDFKVVRYHSLAVSGSLGDEGREIAWTDGRRRDGHRTRDQAAVGRAVSPRVDLHRARAQAVRRTSTGSRASAARRARAV